MNQRIAKAIHELHDALTDYVKHRPNRGETNFYEIECMKIYRACARMLFWAKRNRGE
jgi:hypothetical protein